MASFTARQAASFDHVYRKADEEGDGLMVKCSFCKKMEGCNPDQCEYLIGCGDDIIEWQGDFAIIDEIRDTAAELSWEEEGQHDGLFTGIPFWKSISPAKYEDLGYLISKGHRHIKIHGGFWEGMMINGNFEYAFIDHKHKEKCLKDMKEVVQRLQDGIAAGEG
jgi:hypothetical protein